MKNKLLLCATVDYHFKAFHIPYMRWFQEQGWEVHVAANGDMDLPYVNKKYNIPIQRSPFNLKNIKAFNELKSIINDNDYRIIHCHTPMGGVLTRLAARNARRTGTKLIYTAHGFHFYKGAPASNWILYYPIEKYLAHHTDLLLTINSEDFKRAINHRFNANRIELIHGIGVNKEQYQPIENEKKQELRKKFGYMPDDFLIFYAAEFNRNKNQQLLIKTLAQIKTEVPNARILFAGNGPLLNDCIKLAKEYGVTDMIDFLGWRNDIDELLPMCDIAVSTSLREGLPVNIMEAMSCGLPIVASNNRGHRELVIEGANGFLFDHGDIYTLSNTLVNFYHNVELREEMSKKSIEMVTNYSLENVMKEIDEMYKSII